LSYRAVPSSPCGKSGGKDRQASFPTKRPLEILAKKEIRIGWVPRVAACSPCCRCGSSRLFLDCSWKDAPLCRSVEVDRAFALPLGLRGISSPPQLPAEALRNWARVVQLHLAGMYEDTLASSPSFRQVRRLGRPKRVGCSRFPRDPQCFLALWLPTPLAGIVGRVGFLSRPERRSVQLSPWSGGPPVTPRKTLRSAFTLVGWASCSAPESKPFDGHPAAAPLRVDRKKLLSETRPEAVPKPFFVSPANLSKFLCRQIGLVR